MDLVVEALAYAALKHSAQRRKGVGAAPYINHPIDLLTLLYRAGVREQWVLAAALLHDTVEDTDASLDDLANRFGAQVAAVVGEVSDDKALPKAVRRQKQIEKGPHLSRAARLIKLADKTANLTDILRAPPDWPRERKLGYAQWAGAVIEPIRGTHEGLEAGFDAVQGEALAAFAAVD